MSDDALPEADRVDGAPHPRETVELFGQQPAESAFLDAFAGGRLHHAWLLTGPRGVGKATLAWRIARYLVTAGDGGLFGDVPSADLHTDPASPVFRRTLALSEPAIHLCRRGWDDKAKRLKTALTVDEVRGLKSAFALSAPDGGWRVAIVDAADEMNVSAANALLKLLEEPPAQTVLLLVCHQPSALLPTIRSRCRVLNLQPLDLEDMARAMQAAGGVSEDVNLLHKITGGSVGEALRLTAQDGVALYRRLLAIIGGADRAEVLDLTRTLGGPQQRCPVRTRRPALADPARPPRPRRGVGQSCGTDRGRTGACPAPGSAPEPGPGAGRPASGADPALRPRAGGQP